jgi:hypothetical protein
MAPNAKRPAGVSAGASESSKKAKQTEDVDALLPGTEVPEARPAVPRMAVQPPAAPKEQYEPSWTPVPAGREVMASTYEQMQSIIPFVLRQLPGHVGLKKESDLVAASALQVTDDASSTGYKEVWDVKNCKTSIVANNLYEAGGNLFWLDTQLSTAGSKIDTLIREEPPWLNITDLASQFFSKAALDSGLGSRAAGVSAAGLLVFPLALDAFAADASQFDGIQAPKQLNLVSGHALVWAWYYAAACALLDSDTTMIRKLYNCALSTTIRARVLADAAAVTLLSLRCSETFAGAEKSLSDSFLLWAEKAMSLVDSRQSAAKVAADMDSKGVTHIGTKVSKQMILAAMGIMSVMTPQARCALQAIERCFGRSVISNSYAKLQTISRLSKAGNSAQIGNETAAFVLGSMFLALHRKECAPKWFTSDVMEKSKRDGSPGWFHMTATKRLMVKHVLHCVSCLADESGSSGPNVVDDQLRPAFQDPLAYYNKFCTPAKVRHDDDQAQAAEESVVEEGDSSTDTVAAFVAGLPQFAQGAGEIINAIYCGEHDADLKLLAAEPDVAKAVGQCLDDAGPKVEIAKRLREWMRASSTSTSMVSADKALPGLSVRQLARLSSDAGGVSPEERRDAIAQERSDLWKKAKEVRQKYVQFAIVKTKSADAISQLVNKAGSISQAKAKLNESHRAFVCSMDLLGEADTTPWANTYTPKGPYVDACLAYMATREGNADFCFAFDGRNRTSRRVLEDTFSKCKHTQEIWIVYRLSGSSTAASRKVSFASQAREAVQVKLPCPRVRLTAKDRSEFIDAGEASTHDTTWTGVPACPPSKLPHMSVADKKLMLPTLVEESAIPPKWTHPGVPYLWNEVKSVAFWTSLIESYDIKTIVDMTPGSGQLAHAAMKAGAQYLGLVKEANHLSWLSNAVDRSAIQLIAENGSPLYQQELAEHLREHFAEIVDELNKADVDEEGEEEEEAEDGEDVVLA